MPQNDVELSGSMNTTVTFAMVAAILSLGLNCWCILRLNAHETRIAMIDQVVAAQGAKN